MFGNILVPVDLDDLAAARRAIAIGRRLAGQEHARLAFLTIVPAPRNDEEAAKGEARGALDRLIGALGDDPTIEPLVQIGGSISGRIIESADERGADLIVMASHNPRVTDYLIGSTAAHVVVHARCSVMVVRGEGGPVFSSLLVPVNLDQRQTALQALAVAREFAHRDGASVTVVSVQPVVVDEGGRPPPDYQPRLDAFLARHMEGRPIRGILRLGGSIAGEIRDVAEEIRADLIIMGSRAPHFTDYAIGSNAAHVALHAPVSVLVVR